MQNPLMIKFAKDNPSFTENKIISSLSSERTRADRSHISAGTINNEVKAANCCCCTGFKGLRYRDSNDPLLRSNANNKDITYQHFIIELLSVSLDQEL